MNVLDVGSSKNSVAATIFEIPQEEIFRVDIDPGAEPNLVHDITQPFPKELHNSFDIVMASHVLEHIDREKVLQTTRNLAEVVRVGGELWIMVPSMEWAALEIRKGNNGPVVQMVIFGRQWGEHDYHKSGFTLIELRQLMDIIGFATRKAYQSPLGIGVGDKIYDALQDVVIGYKYQEVEYAIPEPETAQVDAQEPA